MKKRIDIFLENKIQIFILFFILWFAILWLFDLKWNELSPFWQGVLTEAHGMFFDILLFGIILTFYEVFSEKRNDTKRLEEEIDDYRDWQEPEATYRIIGCIKRLSKLKVTAIDLHGCFLRNADFIRTIDLTSSEFWDADLQNASFKAKLTNCCFNGSKLQNAKFYCVDLENATFYLSNLRKADFKDSRLYSASFERADLREVNFECTRINEATEFDEAKVDSINWIESLKGLNIEGYEFIVKNYVVVNERFKDRNGEVYFEIRSRLLIENADKMREQQRNERYKSS